MPSNEKYVQIGEHSILVPQPKKKEDIFFINEKKENAFWQRDKIISQYKQIWFDFLPSFTKMWQPATIYNQDGLLITLNEEDSNYIDSTYLQERQRRLYGIHFKNYEDIIWITGDHYYFLMYARMQRHDGKGQYADYRQFQRDYCYLIHHANITPHILGLFTSKAKKTGITNLHWSGYYLNKATLYKNKNLGYMNINLPQAAKTFNDYFMYSYNGLISPLKPEYRNRSLNEGSIVFAKSYITSKKIRRPVNEDEDDLNTSVFCVPTKPKAFDVAVMSDITFDEPTKYVESFAEIWRTNKEAVKIQSKFNGRAWAFNYTPEEDSASFKEARDVFMESKLSTIKVDSEGQTKSGLIKHHIPAYASWEGAFDKYGNCDEEKANREIKRERDKAKGNKNALQAITRQYANDEREAWSYGGLSSVFDPIRLAELEFNLDELQRSGKTFEWGELQWINPLWEVGKKDKRPKGEFCQVRFVPLTEDELARGDEARMRMYERIPARMENLPLFQSKDDEGNVKPLTIFRHCGGIDPTDYRETPEEGSADAMYCGIIHDETINTANRRVASKIINAEYFYRPDNPEEFYQDVVKWIIYFGCIVIVEANNGWLATRLEAEGLGHYMLWKDSDNNISLYRPNHKNSQNPLKHIKTLKSGNVDTVSDIIRYIKSYIVEAKKEYDELDYGATIKSERLIEQIKKFDPTDTKKFDLVMAFGYWLMCHENYLVLLMKPEEKMYQALYISQIYQAFSTHFATA